MPRQIASIVIVGSSCSGKTSLVDAIRESRIPGISVPLRFVTRPLRENESARENRHVNDDEFSRYVDDGTIAWWWKRAMQGQTSARYGFGRAAPGSLPVYSCNNSLYRSHASGSPRPMQNDTLWIGVFAPLPLRTSRMQRRSGDLSIQEQNLRLADTGEDMTEHVHVLAHSHGEHAPGLAEDVCRLLVQLGPH